MSSATLRILTHNRHWRLGWYGRQRHAAAQRTCELTVLRRLCRMYAGTGVPHGPLVLRNAFNNL